MPTAAPSPVHSNALSGFLLAAFGAIAFSGKAIIVKLGYRHGADAVSLLGLRMLVALPFFILLSIWSSRRSSPTLTSADGWKIGLLGFFGYYLASFLDFAGLAYISATLERLILYLTPTIVLLTGFFVFRRPATRRQLSALLLSYLGVLLAFAHDLSLGGGSIAFGSLLVLLSALSYSIYLVGSGEIVARVGAIRLTAYASSVACILCIGQFLVLRSPQVALDLTVEVWWLSLLNGTLCTVVPVLAVMMAVARIGSATTAQIGMLGPVSTIVLSLVLLGEPMGPWQIVGTFLVLAGVFVVSRSPARS
jgi:drug/metabolite transporter (DMT)-like permease